MKKVRIIALVCILAIALTAVAGCAPGGRKNGDGQTTAPAAQGTQQSTQQTTAQEEPKGPNFDKKISFTWGSFTEIGGDPLYDFIAQKFNVEIKFVPIGWNERKEQVNVMVASGDMPDAVFYEVDKGQLSKWAKDGVIRAMPEIDDRFPTLKKLKDLMVIGVSEGTVDGKLYAWPKFNPSNKWTTLDCINYVYRKDWAEKLGIAKDNDEYTYDEFVEMARRFVNEDPGGNGKGKTIGIADQDFAVPSMLGAYNVYANPLGYKKIDGKYVWGAAMPETLAGIKAIKQMYDEGLYWKDFYTAKGYDAHKLYESGRVGIYYDNFVITNYNNLRVAFKTANPDLDEFKATALMKVKAPDGKFWSRDFANHWSCEIYSPKVDDEKMERMLYIMDWLAGEEGSNYSWFGLKGTDWDDAGGKFELKWQKDSNGVPVSPAYKTMGLRFMVQLNQDYDFVNPLIPAKTVQDVTDWIQLRTDANTNINKFDNFLINLDTPNYLKFGTFSLEFQDEMKKLIASSKDIEKDYNEWLKQMDPKVNEVLKELNGQ